MARRNEALLFPAKSHRPRAVDRGCMYQSYRRLRAQNGAFDSAAPCGPRDAGGSVERRISRNS